MNEDFITECHEFFDEHGPGQYEFLGYEEDDWHFYTIENIEQAYAAWDDYYYRFDQYYPTEVRFIHD